MWHEEANFALAPMVGLPQLPFIRFADEDAVPGCTWKLPAIRRHVRDRAFAWIDDDIGTDCHAWARERATPTLVGGAQGSLIANLVVNFFRQAQIPEGSALAIVIAVFVTIVLIAFRRSLRVEDVVTRG